MKIFDMFAKPIDRDIKGVITIGLEQEEEIQQELSEFVVTRELNRHFHDFYNSFTKSLDSPTDKMGVWISGFFGSGKSHFLKILSYLLENRTVKETAALDYFTDKITDPMLWGDMNRAVQKGDLEVVIFNIDSKASSDSKSKKDAIVEVFNKVFNELQGFSSEIPWLAEMERTMAKEGTYEAFKETYAELAEQPWEERRDIFYYDRDNILTALFQATGMSKESASKWFDDGEKSYYLSIEKFCKNVKDYCNAKGPNHKILFFVDEVGQYIGDNTDLMLNLQTVTEDLGKQLRGRAWIVVTSQEAIDSLTRVKGNDFSKIKGRFSTHLNLSSANTDEVIKERILKKTPVAEDTLNAYYGSKGAIIKNLISFSSNTAEMKSYATAGEFVSLYPFIPYQFNLMQKVFEQIRRMGATGKHLSEGERSMLSAFQESAVSIRDNDVGALIPLSVFYDALEEFLDSNIWRVFLQANDNSNLQKEDIDLLKILFMIKYLKEIPSTIENLTTLSLHHVDTDKIALRKQITESLQRLKKETLIGQSGDEYNFLTHEEQDVSKEIKQVEVDDSEIVDFIAEVVFDDIYKEPKFKYTKNRVFGFNKKVDDRFRGQQSHEITCWLITPLHDWHDMDRQVLLAKTIEHSECVVLRLPPNEKYIDEIRAVKQTEKYLRTKSSKSNSESLQKILNDKHYEVNQAKGRIVHELEEAVKEAELISGGNDIPCEARSAKEVMGFALHSLVENIFKYFDYITHPINSADEVLRILTVNDIEENTFFEVGTNRLALDEVERHIDTEIRMNHKVTLKSLQTKFTRAPYGWGEMDVAGLVARLIVTKKVSPRCGGEGVDRRDKTLHDYLVKSPHAEKLVLGLRESIDTILKERVKKTVKELTGQSSYPNDEDELTDKIRSLLDEQLNEAQTVKVYYQKREYPGKETVEQFLALLETVQNVKENKPYFEAIDTQKNNLLDLHEDLDAVKGFFNNMVPIFDDASNRLSRFKRNRLYLSDDCKSKLDEIQSILESKNPYNRIKDLPSLVDDVAKDIQGKLDDLKSSKKKVIESQRAVLTKALDDKAVEGDERDTYLKPLDELMHSLENYDDCNQVAAVESHLQQLVGESLKKIAEIPGTTENEEKVIEHVNFGSLRGDVRTIKTEEELERFVASLREKIKSMLDEEKEVIFY